MNALERILEAHKQAIDKLNARVTTLETIVNRLHEELEASTTRDAEGLVEGEEVVG